LPATAPGSTRDEGVFLITAADDGSRAVYFIAQNTRHSILSSDLQLEQQLNPLWPVRSVSRDEVLAFPEAAPIGSAKTGLIKITIEASAPAEAAPDNTAEDMPTPVAEPLSPVVALPSPAARTPAPSPMPHAASPMLIDLQPAPSTNEPTVHVLQSGDNLTRISVRYGTTIEAILAANGIVNANRIYVGQSLVIPGSAPTFDVVESPAAPQPVASDFQEPVADSPASDGGQTTYTVKRGDSAITIARQFGVDVNELLAANGIVNRNRVYVDQVLALPGA
jgi:LysM repeat protein